MGALVPLAIRLGMWGSTVYFAKEVAETALTGYREDGITDEEKVELLKYEKAKKDQTKIYIVGGLIIAVGLYLWSKFKPSKRIARTYKKAKRSIRKRKR